MNKAIVCVPTYNEKENVERIVKAITDAAETDVLIIDDGSPDGTGEIVDELAKADERVNILHRTAKEGLGKAYIDGFRHCLDKGYERILQMDADFSHPVDLLPNLIQTTDQADLAIASRYVKGGGTENWPVSRQFISKGGSFYSRMVLGVGIRDLTGGYKCWRAETLREILANPIQMTGFGFQIEMNYRAIRLGFKVVEVPYVFVERTAGNSKMSGGIFSEALKMVWKLRFMDIPHHGYPHPMSIITKS